MKQSLATFSILRWTLMTWAGWFVGVAFVIALSMLTEVIGIHVGGQAAVGIGMGAGVGLMQWLYLKRLMPVTSNWFWLSILGFMIAYVLFDVFLYLSESKPDLLLIIATAVGAVLAGWFQYKFILRKFNPNSKAWIVYNSVAWILAHASMLVIFSPQINFKQYFPRVVTVILAFTLITVGGPILGFITGRFMRSMFNYKSADRASHDE